MDDKNLKIVERFGDVNPIEHAGGVLIKGTDKDGNEWNEVEYTEGLEVESQKFPTFTREELEEGIPVYTLLLSDAEDDWIKREDIELHTGREYDLTKDRDRAQYMIDAGSYYGLGNFGLPSLYSWEVLEKRWELGEHDEETASEEARENYREKRGAKEEKKKEEKRKKDIFTETMICEGVEDASEERQIEAWQYMIDTGTCWILQGWFGRTAKSLIDQGLCEAAK